MLYCIFQYKIAQEDCVQAASNRHHFHLVITVQSYSQAGILQQVLAQPPSFVRQEMIDDSSDWLFWRGSSSNKIQLNTHDNKMLEVDRADNSSECEIDENFIPPDIQSVSYVSDGNNLTATMWLTSQFEEPPLNYTIDTFSSSLALKLFDDGKPMTYPIPFTILVSLVLIDLIFEMNCLEYFD